MLIVLDTNPSWHESLFRALPEPCEVLGVKPHDVGARNRPVTPYLANDPLARHGGLYGSVSVGLPPGWASKSAALSQRLLWRRIRGELAKRKREASGVVFTFPQYHVLAARLCGSLPLFYYCSDDYSAWTGWPEKTIPILEHTILQRVDHAFFVSEALAERAIERYGISRESVSVSMDATEAAFFPSSMQVGPPPSPYASLPRPIVGVIGNLSAHRIDMKLLRRVADMPEIGTLLLVGNHEADTASDENLRLLKGHDRCTMMGFVPKASLPAWYHCLDIALIPYLATRQNYYCSPVRLFDYLASGIPIISTDTCDQLHAFREYVCCCRSPEDVEEQIRLAISNGSAGKRNMKEMGCAREHVWGKRAENLLTVLRRYLREW